MNNIIETLDINLRSIVLQMGKFSAFAIGAMISLQLISNNNSEWVVQYFIYSCVALIAILLLSILVWWIWAYRHSCADGETVTIIAALWIKVVIIYTCILALVLTPLIAFLLSNIIENSAITLLAIVISIGSLWKIDDKVSDYLLDGIFGDLQT